MAYLDKPTISWIPDIQYVKKFSDYHLENRQKYPNIFPCENVKDVVNCIKRILFTKDSPMILSNFFGHHDMENSKRLLEWLLRNNIK